MKGNTHPWRGTWGSPFGRLWLETPERRSGDAGWRVTVEGLPLLRTKAFSQCRGDVGAQGTGALRRTTSIDGMADRHCVTFSPKAEPIAQPLVWLDRTEVRHLQGR